ncbi:hypothetical protein JZ751_012929, partial [Albula glossodonta]
HCCCSPICTVSYYSTLRLLTHLYCVLLQHTAAAHPSVLSLFEGNPMAVIGPGVGAGIGVLFILLGTFIYLRKRRGTSKTEDFTADVSSADSNHGDSTTQKETQIQQLEQTEAADEDIYANSTYSPPKKPKAAAPRVT